MGCNCGGGNGRATKYKLTTPQGEETVYLTLTEAKKALAMAGGGTITPVT